MFVDIYPFDNFCQDDAWIKKNRKMIVWIDRCGRKRFLKSKTFLRSAGKYIAFCISRFLNLNRLLQKDDICAQKYNGNGDAVLVKCSCWELEENQVFPKRFFEKTISHEFNGELFPIPICYDELLKICYGDYLKLPPLKDRVGHHDYQAYRKKEQFWCFCLEFWFVHFCEMISWFPRLSKTIISICFRLASCHQGFSSYLNAN